MSTFLEKVEYINLIHENLDLQEEVFKKRKEFRGLNQELLNVYRSNYIFILQQILDTPDEDFDRLKIVAKYLLERAEE